MKHFRPMEDYSNHQCAISIFLAGSIAADAAEDWQQVIVDSMSVSSVALLNPRSENWVEPETDEEFGDLVTWDWDAMMYADFVIVYFDGKTQSPVTLMELGMLALEKPYKTIVVCPDEFWRSKHVNVLCERYGMFKTDSIYGVLDWFHIPHDTDD